MSQQTPAATDVDAILQEIHDGLTDDGLYVHPSLASQVTDEQAEAIAENLAQDDEPTFVVIYPLEPSDVFAGSVQDLLVRLVDEHPEPGTYFALTSSYTYADDVSFDGRTHDVPGTPDDRTYGPEEQVLNYETHPTAGEGAERLTELRLLPPDEVQQIADDAREQRCETTDTCGGGGGGSDDGDGVGLTGVVVALVIAVVVVLAAVSIAAGAARRRPAAATQAVRRPQAFRLPPSAVERIREAHDRDLEKRARDELLALGETIEAADIAESDDRAAWQAALDHYDAARWAMTRDEDPEVLDVVGALVLARRGTAALGSARRGRAWEPPYSCYLNPLHDEPTGHHELTDDRDARTDSSARRVPVCRACLDDLRSGELPDTLDVAVDGKPTHYFDAAAEPWASTGYGALERDLVTAVQRTRR